MVLISNTVLLILLTISGLVTIGSTTSSQKVCQSVQSRDSFSCCFKDIQFSLVEQSGCIEIVENCTASNAWTITEDTCANFEVVQHQDSADNGEAVVFSSCLRIFSHPFILYSYVFWSSRLQQWLFLQV